MIYEISGKSLPSSFPFATVINEACSEFHNMPPLFVGAIAWRETLSVMSPEAARVFVSGDDGHGIFQLTSSWPDDWQDPRASCDFAIDQFLERGIGYWHGLHGFTGVNLIRLVAATYNAGLGWWYGPGDRRNSGAIGGHMEGDVDKYTTDRYGSGVLTIFQNLLATGKPTGA